VDFYAQQDRARQQSRLLIGLFALAVLVVVALNYLLLATLIQPLLKPLPHTTRQHPFLITIFLLLGEVLMHPLQFGQWLLDARLAGWITLGTLMSIAAGCYYEIRLLSRGGPAVAVLLGGRRIDPGTSDVEERKLLNVVEEMAIASVLPVPEVYVLDRERGVNTFAAGHTHDDVAVGVTLGGLKLLNRDELQGVIAHEFSHVLNGDTRLNLKLMGLMHGLFWPTIVGRVLLRGTSRAPEIGESLFFEAVTPMRLPLLPFAMVLFLLGGVGAPLVRWIKSRICREREWLADAAAVQFTRNPDGLAGALKKIGGLLKQGRLDTPFAETASHLYFSNCRHEPWFRFLSTHPPLNKRVLAMDPAFDGQFPHIQSLPSRDAEYDQRYEESVRRARAEAEAHPENWPEP